MTKVKAKPRKRPSKPAAQDIDRVVEIERLAALEPIEYEATRIDAAMRLTVRASILDREVTKKRRALGLETRHDDGQGRAVKMVDPLPWHEPVDGDRLATTLAAGAKTYLALSDAAADTIALWGLYSWVVNEFTMSPRLAITSPTKGCGKTTVLRLLEHIVRRPKRSGSISPAALFRIIEKYQPTMLLDENEKYMEPGGEYHALLNEGHCVGATVTRVLGDGLELREFAVFAAVAFARNGRVPDDLEQRSIVIEMQRRQKHEKIKRLPRNAYVEALQQMARMCSRWADDNHHLLTDRDYDLEELINRVSDNWLPLFAIADVIGADWPERVRQAAAVLVVRESESIGPLLLADISVLFDSQQIDRVLSVELCEGLEAIEGRPWADWKNGKPITPNQLARLLKPFHVAPTGTIRVGSKTGKGYYRHQFEEAWLRYLAPEGLNEPSHRHNATAAGTSAHFEPSQPEYDVTVQNYEKPLSPSGCDGVTVEKGVSPLNGEVGPSSPSQNDVENDVDEDRSCRQCDDTLDGTETAYVIHGERTWLHPECQPEYLKAHPERTNTNTEHRGGQRHE